jgi:hypothetical protein
VSRLRADQTKPRSESAMTSTVSNSSMVATAGPVLSTALRRPTTDECGRRRGRCTVCRVKWGRSHWAEGKSRPVWLEFVRLTG